MSQPFLQCPVLAMFGGAVVKQGGGAQVLTVLTLSWTAARKPSGAQTAAKGGMITSGQHATFTIFATSHVSICSDPTSPGSLR